MAKHSEDSNAHCDLELKDSNPNFFTKHSLLLMYQHMKFGLREVQLLRKCILKKYSLRIPAL